MMLFFPAAIVAQLPAGHPPVSLARALGTQVGSRVRRLQQEPYGLPTGKAEGYWDYAVEDTFDVPGAGFDRGGGRQLFGTYAAIRALARRIGEPVCYGSMQSLPPPADEIPTLSGAQELRSLCELGVDRLHALGEAGYPVMFSGVTIGQKACISLCENSQEMCDGVDQISLQPLAMAVFEIKDDDAHEELFWEMYDKWMKYEHGAMEIGHLPNIEWSLGACRSPATGEADYAEQSCPNGERVQLSSGEPFWGNGGGLLANLFKCSDFPAEYQRRKLHTEGDVDAYIRTWQSMPTLKMSHV